MPTGKGFVGATKALALFKQSLKHSKSPADLVRLSLDILRPLAGQGGTPTSRPTEKALDDLERYLDEMVHTLYGDAETHPNPEAVTALTQEIFKTDFLLFLIRAVPKLKDPSRQPATQIVASLQRQQIQSRYVASEYLAAHPEILDLLLQGYESPDVALFYGSMLRDCLRHQEAARYLLQSKGYEALFKYIEQPQFEISSDAAATFKEVLLRHKSTASEFLVQNYDRFFTLYDRLLKSEEYVTRRTAMKVLADMLGDRAYTDVLARYAKSPQNLMFIMNALKDSSKSIQLDAFNVFKAIVLHPGRSEEVTRILTSNSDKLQRFLQAFSMEKLTEPELKTFENNKQELLAAIKSL